MHRSAVRSCAAEVNPDLATSHRVLAEDCQILAQLLAAGKEPTEAAQVCDIPKVLQAYNKLRFEDAHAVCQLSEIGAALTVRKILAAQLILTLLLNKTLGRLAPKVRRQSPSTIVVMKMENVKPCSISETEMFYASCFIVHGRSNDLFRRPPCAPPAHALLLATAFPAAFIVHSQPKEQAVWGDHARNQEGGCCCQRGNSC